MQRWLAYAAGAVLAMTGGWVEVRAEIEILYLEPSTTSPVLSTISTESEDFQRSEVVAGTGGWRRVSRADSYSGFIREEALDAEGTVKPGSRVYLTPSENASELTSVAPGDEVRVNFVDDWTEISIRKSIPGFVRPSAPPPTGGFLPPLAAAPEEAVVEESVSAPEAEPEEAVVAPPEEAGPMGDASTSATGESATALPEAPVEEPAEDLPPAVPPAPAETAAAAGESTTPPGESADTPSAQPTPTEPVGEDAEVAEGAPAGKAAQPEAEATTPPTGETTASGEPAPVPEPPTPTAGEGAIPPREEASVEEEIVESLPPEVPVNILPVDRSLPARPAEAGPDRAQRQPVPARVERRVPAPPADILRTFRGRLELNRSTFGIAREFRLQLVNSRGSRIAFIDDSEVASASWIDRVGERVRVIGSASPSSGTGRFVIRAVNIIPW